MLSEARLNSKPPFRLRPTHLDLTSSNWSFHAWMHPNHWYGSPNAQPSSIFPNSGNSLSVKPVDLRKPRGGVLALAHVISGRTWDASADQLGTTPDSCLRSRVLANARSTMIDMSRSSQCRILVASSSSKLKFHQSATKT